MSWKHRTSAKCCFNVRQMSCRGPYALKLISSSCKCTYRTHLSMYVGNTGSPNGIETEKRESIGYFTCITCSYTANIDWPHYSVNRYIVHESNWKYTYVTQFCPQPFTFAFNLCGVCICVKASVCRVFYTPRALSEKKGPLCVGLTFQQPAVGPSCDLCTHTHTHAFATSHHASLRSRPPGTRSGLIYPWTPAFLPPPCHVLPRTVVFLMSRGAVLRFIIF